MTTNIKRNNKGFTIVETLIVLAIAAVIIIIVLLAVPALQRTTRNTDIKNDATSIAAGFNDYSANQAGGIPVGFTFAAGKLSLCSLASCKGATNITGATVTIQPGDKINAATAETFDTVAALPTATPGQINIYVGFACKTTVGTNTVAPTSGPNQVAIMYPDETGAGTNLLCAQG